MMSDLSTAEKLASLNPAARAEGQRELAQQSTSEQQKTAKKAVEISQRGYTGTVPLEIKQPTPTAAEEAAQQSLIDRGGVSVAPTAAEEAAQQSLIGRGRGTTLHVVTPYEVIQGTTPEEREERAEQELIRQEKAKDLSLTTRDVRVGWELKFRPGTSVIGKAGYEAYGRLRAEEPGLTRFAESAVMGAATVLIARRLPSPIIREAEKVIVPAYVIGKATEFKTKPFKPFVIETVQELTGFAVGGLAVTRVPSTIYAKAKAKIEPRYRYYKYTGKIKPDYEVSIKPTYKWEAVTEKFGIRGKFTPRDVEVIGRSAKEVQLQLYPKRITKEPIIKTVEKPSFKAPEFQKLRTEVARETNKWLGQYVERGALERATLTESQLRLLRARTRELGKIEYISGVQPRQIQLKFPRAYEDVWDYGKVTTKVIETKYPFTPPKLKFLVGKKAAILAPPEQIRTTFQIPGERLLGPPRLVVEPTVKPIVKFAEQPPMAIVSTKERQKQIQQQMQVQVLSLKQVQQQVQIRTLSQVQIQKQIQQQTQFQVPRQVQRQVPKQVQVQIPKQIVKQVPKEILKPIQVPKIPRQPKIPKEKIPKTPVPTLFLRPKFKKPITIKKITTPKIKPVTAYAPTLHAVIGQIKIPTIFKKALKKKKKKRMFFTGLEPRGI